MAFGVVGMLGMIPFYCSDKTVYTFNDLHRSNSMRFASHEVIGQKPVLESLAGSYRQTKVRRFHVKFHQAYRTATGPSRRAGIT